MYHAGSITEKTNIYSECLENNRWFSAVCCVCTGEKYMAITRVVRYFESGGGGIQLKTIYYCHSYIIPQFGNHQIDFVPKIN